MIIYEFVKRIFHDEMIKCDLQSKKYDRIKITEIETQHRELIIKERLIKVKRIDCSL